MCNALERTLAFENLDERQSSCRSRLAVSVLSFSLLRDTRPLALYHGALNHRDVSSTPCGVLMLRVSRQVGLARFTFSPSHLDPRHRARKQNSLRVGQ